MTTNELPDQPAEEATGATEATGWEDAQAAARDAVASTLEESGYWLPDAVRRRIANSVVYAVAGRLPDDAVQEGR